MDIKAHFIQELALQSDTTPPVVDLSIQMTQEEETSQKLISFLQSHPKALFDDKTQHCWVSSIDAKTLFQDLEYFAHSPVDPNELEEIASSIIMTDLKKYPNHCVCFVVES